MKRPETLVLERENTDLKLHIFELEKDKKTLEDRLQYHQEQYDQLIHQITQANRARFGSKSEKYKEMSANMGESGQLSLFEDTMEIAEIVTTADEKETITYTRKKKKNKSQLTHLPRREEIITVKEQDRICACGCQKELIRYEIKKIIHHQPAVFEIIEQKREVLACPKKCGSAPIIAENPLTALPKVMASEELLSYIAVSKILDRQPLYHLEKQFLSRYQVNISRQTMARWMIGMGKVLQPIINALKDTILAYDIGGLDATSLQVLKEPGRKPETKSDMYCMHGGPPGKEVILYEYNATEHKPFLADWFAGFKGILHVDADLVFENLPLIGALLSKCNAHARRKFEVVAKSAKKDGLARKAMLYYMALYKIEREAKNKKMNPKDRLALRQQKTKPIWDEFEKWLISNKDKVLPKSPLGQAITYTLKHWIDLGRFLEDGRLEIDNNQTERYIKDFVMGRKNFLFSDTVCGAEALAQHYGLMVTAKRHNLDPLKYYVTLLKRIPYCKTFEDYDQLLPWNIKRNPSPSKITSSLGI
jgi:transposase